MGNRASAGVPIFCDDGSILIEPTGRVSAVGGGGGGPPTGVAGGDLGGTYPNPQVDGLQNVPVSAAAPLSGQFLGYNGAVWIPTTLPAFPGSLPPSGPATGDLSGTYPAPLVDGLQGRPVAATAPAAGEFLAWDGAQWEPTPAPGGGGPPTGAAGGDLGGTYPNPTVDGVQGVSVPAAPTTTGQVLTYDGTNLVFAAPAASLPPSGPASGDLAGTYPGPTVDGLQGRPVSAAAPATGDVLGWDGANWEPTAFTVGGVEAATPSTVPLRTAAGGLRANDLTADAGDLDLGFTLAAPAAPSFGGSVNITAQDATTNGEGGFVIVNLGDAASPGIARQGGSMLVNLGTSAGTAPPGGRFQVARGVTAILTAGISPRTGNPASTDTVTGGDLLPAVNTGSAIGATDLLYSLVHGGQLVAHADALNNVKVTVDGDSVTATTTAAGTLGPLLMSSRDILLAGQVRNVVVATTFAAPTTTVDLDTGAIQRLTLSADTTIDFVNERDGARFVLEVEQGIGAGGNTITWPAGIVWPNGQPPVLSRASGARDTFTFYREGGGGAAFVLESFVSEGGHALGYHPVALAAGANYTARRNDYIRQAATATATITLPDATALNPNHCVTYKNTSTGVLAITFDVAGAGGTIDGAATYVGDDARGGYTFCPAGNGTNTWDAFPPA